MSTAAIHTISDFSRQYYLLRKTEGRIYSDEEVASLPLINDRHKYFQEWAIRKKSCDKLVKYLADKNEELLILEVGCGNGWLSANLSSISNSRLTGIDINTEELVQAKRVFGKIGNLEFINCSLNDALIETQRFDIIIFAASVQYFSSLKKILTDALDKLNPGGEIHLVDSHFYSQQEVNSARQRTEDYYRSIGFPGMIDHYFHHSMSELEQIDHDILYDPSSLVNRLKKNRNPFYWIRVNA